MYGILYQNLENNRAPIPHLHNSGWVQAPGAAILGDLNRHDELETYIKGIITTFTDDERVIMWGPYIMNLIMWLKE